MIERNKYFGIG